MSIKLFLCSLALTAAAASAVCAHSGGLNSKGCHAGSKPYHCHRAQQEVTPTAATPSNHAHIASSRVSVRDVDTIVVGGPPVRLNGVDGPEVSTYAGKQAREWMVSLLRGETVICKLNGERTHDRMVGVCYIGQRDIGALAISAGHALDCARYSRGRYKHLEQPSAQSRLGRAAYCK
ncbi:thermonuclease family protein [Tateyamaria sp.]|uniref:thermonuclease family protein n=1 Tax=Tateyamaria sp. TaxID=1929288 RepID=UPI0032DE0E7E